MMFGIATVNKYYDYYQNWGGIAADLGNQGRPGNCPVHDPRAARQRSWAPIPAAISMWPLHGGLA